MQRRALMGSGAAAAAVLALGQAGCAPRSTPGGSTGSGAGTTLNVWTWRVEDEAAYNELFATYTEQHPDVTINYRAYKSSEYNQILATGLAGSDGPDICMVKQYGALQATIASDGIIPLDDKVDNLANFAEPVLDGVRGKQDGKVYGVPFALQTIQVFYNTQVFEQHQLEPPSTYQEFLDLCETLKDAGIVPIAVPGQDAAVATPIAFDALTAARYGGKEFEQAVLRGEKKFSSPEYVAALQMIKDLQPYFPEKVTGTTGDDAHMLLATGKAAMYPSGTYDLQVLKSLKDDLEIDYFSMPVGPDWAADGPVMPAYMDGGYAVARNSRNVDAAVDLVNWMGSAEYGHAFAGKLQQLSPNNDVTLDDPVMQRMKTDYADHGCSYLMLVGFRYGQPWGTDLLGAAIQKVLLDKATPQQAAAEIDEGLSTWFTPGE